MLPNKHHLFLSDFYLAADVCQLVYSITKTIGKFSVTQDSKIAYFHGYFYETYALNRPKLNFENHMTFESTFKVLDRENTV